MDLVSQCIIMITVTMMCLTLIYPFNGLISVALGILIPFCFIVIQSGKFDETGARITESKVEEEKE